MEANRRIYIDIESILNDEEKQQFYKWLEMPAFALYVKMIKQAEYQWGYQLIKKDYSTDRQKAFDDLIKTQGQREGLLIPANSLIEWKKKVKRESDNSKK